MCVEGEETILSGAHGKANVGVDGDGGWDMRPRRRAKVSRAGVGSPGSVGS